MFEKVYRPQRLLGAAASTIGEMRRTLRLLALFAGRDLLIAELTDALVADFMQWLLAGGRRRVTVNAYRGRLLAIWRLAGGQGLLPRDPRVKKLREDVDPPDAWSSAEMARIVAAIHKVRWRKKICGISAALWWEALLRVAYWTGLRRGTLLHLRHQDVDLVGGWVTVPGDAIKTRRGKRFRVGQDAIQALRAIWLPRRELLFPLSFDLRNFSRRFDQIIARAGVAPSSRRTLTQMHKIRRTVATLTAASRGLHAACDLLGHSDAYVTLRYVDASKLPGADATEFLPLLTVGQQPAIKDSSAKRLAAATPAMLLDEARQLFALGYPAACAAIGRVALRSLLSGWHQAAAGAIPKRCTIRHLATQLQGRRIVDCKQSKLIDCVDRIGSRAVRGNPIDAAQARRLLTALDQLVPLPVPLLQES